MEGVNISSPFFGLRSFIAMSKAEVAFDVVVKYFGFI